MTQYRIVDVCGTLVKDDTTLGLLKWHFARSRRWRLRLLQLYTSQSSPVRLVFVVLERVTGRHILKHQLVRWLKGDAVADVQASADQYAEWLLANRKVGDVWNLLERTGSAGPVVLASASLDPIVHAIAVRMSARHVASSLATRDGRYLGCYERDLTGQKNEALSHVLPTDWQSGNYIAISDNLTDRSLLEGAVSAYVVLHDERHRRRWNDMPAEYITA